jgi:hypothetical protein
MTIDKDDELEREFGQDLRQMVGMMKGLIEELDICKLMDLRGFEPLTS